MKKVLILTSTGGGGTLSASTAIENYLKNDYEITTINVFNDLLKSIDFCSILTFKKYSCEEIYNFFILRKYFRILTILYHFGRWYIYFRRKQIRSILYNYIVKTKPSLIISVIPIINNIVLSIAQELNIPFLLIPTDLDINMYILNIVNPTYQHFHIGIPFNDEQLKAPLKKSAITSNYISVIGSPLKHNFFTLKNNNLLKEEFSIPENKPIIMLLMGAQGSYDIEQYVNQLIKIKIPVHLIVCTGKNKKQILHTCIPQHISISIIQFTTRIADLMSLSDIIITKSGSLSVSEAIYMNVPLILDATSTILPWEKLNHTFVKIHGFGTSITHYSDIVPLITSFLSKPDILIRYKNNLKHFEKEDIEIQLKKCIDDMLKT